MQTIIVDVLETVTQVVLAIDTEAVEPNSVPMTVSAAPAASPADEGEMEEIEGVANETNVDDAPVRPPTVTVAAKLAPSPAGTETTNCCWLADTDTTVAVTGATGSVPAKTTECEVAPRLLPVSVRRVGDEDSERSVGVMAEMVGAKRASTTEPDELTPAADTTQRGAAKSEAVAEATMLESEKEETLCCTPFNQIDGFHGPKFTPLTVRRPPATVLTPAAGAMAEMLGAA